MMKTVGAASVALTTPVVGVGAAKDDETSTGVEEIGIREEVRTLLDQGKYNEADRILSKHDVAHDRQTVSMPSIGSEGSSSTEGEVSPRSEWGEGKSTFTLGLYHSSGDRYEAYTGWTLRKAGSLETAGPPDGVGITVSDNLWKPAVGSQYAPDRTSFKKQGPQGAIFNYNDPNGPASVPDGSRSGSAYYSFDKIRSGTNAVYGSYVHTWCPGGICGDISFSFSAKFLGFSISGRVDTWEKHATATA